MKLSAKAEYACLAIIALARQGLDSTPVRVREIAETHGIPERYLVQILIQLKGAGLGAGTSTRQARRRDLALRSPKLARRSRPAPPRGEGAGGQDPGIGRRAPARRRA